MAGSFGCSGFFGGDADSVAVDEFDVDTVFQDDEMPNPSFCSLFRYYRLIKMKIAVFASLIASAAAFMAPQKASVRKMPTACVVDCSKVPICVDF